MERKALILFSLLALVSCEGEKKQEAPTPPSPVTFAVAQAEDVPYTLLTFGNCRTVASVTLQAQVEGTLLKFGVSQGAMVKAGDLIAEIDPASYQAALQEAEGQLASAKAKLANSQLALKRKEELYKTKTIDLADLQTAQADELAAQGDVLLAEGEQQVAKINLGYCRITSPIDGKVGMYLVDAGNLVSADATEIINIQTIDPIYVDFSISENDFDKVRKYLSAGDLVVEASIPGGESKKMSGKLSFMNNRIASDTGTLMLQGTFSNPEASLWPGLFVNVRLILTTLKDAVVIPSQCVMTGQEGPYVFVVNADDTVSLRTLSPGESQGDFTVISEGLEAGEKVVTAGQLGLDTGLKVNPTPWKPGVPGK